MTSVENQKRLCLSFKRSQISIDKALLVFIFDDLYFSLVRAFSARKRLLVISIVNIQ